MSTYEPSVTKSVTRVAKAFKDFSTDGGKTFSVTKLELNKLLEDGGNELVQNLQKANAPPAGVYPAAQPGLPTKVSGTGVSPPLIAGWDTIVPAGVSDWPLMHALFAMRLHKDATAGTKTAHDFVKGAFADWQTVVCPICGGFGHVQTGCKTALKIQKFFTGQPVPTHLIKEAKTVVNNQTRMPASYLGKRKRAQFDGDIERITQEDVVLNLSSIF